MIDVKNGSVTLEGLDPELTVQRPVEQVEQRSLEPVSDRECRDQRAEDRDDPPAEFFEMGRDVRPIGVFERAQAVRTGNPGEATTAPAGGLGRDAGGHRALSTESLPAAVAGFARRHRLNLDRNALG